MALTEISWFIAGMLATCGIWVFFRLAQGLFIKDAIAEIKVKK